MHWKTTHVVEEKSPHKEKCCVSLGTDIAGIKCTCGEIHPPHPDLDGEMDPSQVWSEAEEKFVFPQSAVAKDPYAPNPRTGVSCF